MNSQSCTPMPESQSVVCRPPVVRSHLPGGVQARPNIYMKLRGRYANRQMFAISLFFFISINRKQPYRVWNCLNTYKFRFNWRKRKFSVYLTQMRSLGNFGG